MLYHLTGKWGLYLKSHYPKNLKNEVMTQVNTFILDTLCRFNESKGFSDFEATETGKKKIGHSWEWEI